MQGSHHGIWNVVNEDRIQSKREESVRSSCLYEKGLTHITQASQGELVSDATRRLEGKDKEFVEGYGTTKECEGVGKEEFQGASSKYKVKKMRCV